MRRLLRSLLQSRDRVPSDPGPSQLRMLAEFGVSQTGEPLPAGYRAVTADRARYGAWVRLLDDSGDFGHFDRAMLEREVLSIMIPGGGVLVEHEGELVACATAAFAKRFAPYALLNYVLVKPDQRGRGLGRWITAEVMACAARGRYPGMILQTDDSRDAAISMYLALGFKPVADTSPGDLDRWRLIMQRLGQPFP